MRTMTGWLSALALGATLALGSLPGAAAAQEQQAAAVTPSVGSFGTTFKFAATGFRGDVDRGDNDNKNDAELIVYWISAPDGRIFDAQLNDNKEPERYEIRALRDGSASWSWAAPADAAPGSYVMTARGEKSGVERVVTFEVQQNAPGIPVQGGAKVSPASGSLGSEFIFVANGFRGNDNADDKNNNGERVAYWINAPDGRIISADPDDGDDDKRDASGAAYVAKADRNGQVQWTWTAFAGLPAGDYVMVARGLDSNREVAIPFSVQ